MKLLRLLAFVFFAVLSLPGRADDGAPWYDRAWQNVTDAYYLGNTEYYATFRTWHPHGIYSEDQIKTYQNWPFGLGVGRGRYDDKGDWRGVYVMGFQDSHFKPEWIVGYGWKTHWQIGAESRVGLGYTAGVTTRTDYGNYTPVPLLLPIATLEYRNFSVEGAWVPGGRHYGNVVLFWLKMHSDNKSLFGIGG